jgi:penicillin-binding protein 2
MLELGRWIDVAGLEPRPRWSPRLVAMALVVCLAMALVFQRLFVLQVIEGRTFIAAADANHTRRVVLEAERGVVYDRHGNQLVVNQPSWTLEVIPGALPSDPRQRSRALDSLASAGGVPVTDLRARVGGAADPYSAVPVRQHLDARQAQVAAERLPELPGARLRQQPYRSYVDAPVFSHLLGYTGPLDPREAAALKPQGYQPTEWLGRAGIEAGAEAQLRGQDGWADVETDARGVETRTLRSAPAASGNNVYLSIDAGFQRAVTGFLAEGVAKAKSRAGAAIVVDPRTGEVLAESSQPGYDSNLFSRGISEPDYRRLVDDPARPLFDRALAGTYPPGSTFKMVTAAAGLQEGKIQAGSQLACPNSLQYGGWVYRNWAGYDMGPMNVTKAIAVSCDTFFYQVADRVGDQALARYAREFGYGSSPPIEVPGAAAGIVPDRNWKAVGCHGQEDCRWNPGDTITMGIGQSYLVTTPLIQAMYVAAMANGGHLLAPELVREVRDATGRPLTQAQPRTVNDIAVSPDVIATVREGMRQCLSAPYGTGFLFRAEKAPYDGGCKTGTAQYGGSGTDLPTHAWFVFFTPFQNPEIAMVVFVEGGGEGHDAAEPVAVKIADWYYAHRAEVRS